METKAKTDVLEILKNKNKLNQNKENNNINND